MRRTSLLVSGLILLAVAGAASAQGGGGERAGGLGLTLGSVKAVNAGKRQLTIAVLRRGRDRGPGTQPGGERIVNVAPDALMFRLGPARATDLRPGDMLNVVGLPMQIDARQIRIGDVPPGAVPRPRAGPPPTPAPKGPPRPGQPRPAAGPSPQRGGSMSRLFGKVTRLTPLQITLPGGINVQVKTTRDTRFTRAIRLTLAQVKVGEPVMIFGPPGAGGAITANRIQVGLEGFPTQRSRS